MKKYIIKKIAYANSIEELESLFPGGQTVYIELQDDISDVGEIGFKPQIIKNGKRERN